MHDPSYWHRKALDEIAELRDDARYWRKRAEKAEMERESWEENHQILCEHLDRVVNRAERADTEVQRLSRNIDVLTLTQLLTQDRANSWFETSKIMVRARDWWIEIAEEQSARADSAEALLDEFKAALRTLSR